MIQIKLEHFQKVQHHGLIINQSQHDNAEGILQLSMFIQLIQQDIGIDVFPELNTYAHPLPAGMIIQTGDTIHLFIPDKFGNLLNQTGFVYQIGKLRDRNPGLTVGHGFYICSGTNTDFTAARPVSFFDPSGSQYCSACGKIRSLYDLQNFL